MTYRNSLERCKPSKKYTTSLWDWQQFRIGLAFSKWPYFDSAYLLGVSTLFPWLYVLPKEFSRKPRYNSFPFPVLPTKLSQKVAFCVGKLCKSESRQSWIKSVWYYLSLLTTGGYLTEKSRLLCSIVHDIHNVCTTRKALFYLCTYL